MSFKNTIRKAAELGIGFTVITSILSGCNPFIPGLDSGSDNNISGDSCTYVNNLGKTSCSDTFSYPSGASDSCANSSSAVLYSSRTYAPNLCPSSGVVAKCGSTANLPNTYYYTGYSSADLTGLISVCTSNGGTWSTPTTTPTTTGATVGVTGTWISSYNTNYTNAKCTFLNGPGTATWIWTEDSAGKITSSTSSTTVTNTNRTRAGNTITSTGYWNNLGVSRTDYFTWNGTNTITGNMTAICYSSTTLLISQEIQVPFTATRQ